MYEHPADSAHPHVVNPSPSIQVSTSSHIRVYSARILSTLWVRVNVELQG